MKPKNKERLDLTVPLQNNEFMTDYIWQNYSHRHSFTWLNSNGPIYYVMFINNIFLGIL